MASSILRRSAEPASGLDMTRRTCGRIATLVVVIAFASLVLACLIYRPDRALRTATGSAAHDLCSETFVSQLDPEQVFVESLSPRPGFRWIAWAVNHHVDPTRRGMCSRGTATAVSCFQAACVAERLEVIVASH